MIAIHIMFKDKGHDTYMTYIAHIYSGNPVITIGIEIYNSL